MKLTMGRFFQIVNGATGEVELRRSRLAGAATAICTNQQDFQSPRESFRMLKHTVNGRGRLTLKPP